MNADSPVIAPAEFRRVMGCFATGVTVVTAVADNEIRGMTANAFMSGSLDPPLLVISVACRAAMHGHLLKAGAFGVSVLASAQLDIAAHFGGRRIEGFNVPFTFVGDVPIVPGTVATMTARTAATYPCGDHTLFVGRIQSLSAANGMPLLFHGGRYASFMPDITLPTPPEIQ